MLVALAVASPALAGGNRTVPYWGQAQGHLASLAGAPLLAANWEGRYRPYVFRGGRYVALVPQGAPAWPTLDLTTPLAVSATEVLLAGTEAGGVAYDIFLYDTRARTLQNLTNTRDADEAAVCVDPDSRLIAYHAPDGEHVARLADGLRPLEQPRLPPFARCIFAAGPTLLGVEARPPGEQLHRCTFTADRVSCEEREALHDVEEVTQLARASGTGVTVVGRRRGAMFRRAYRLDGDGHALAEIPVPGAARADVLDWDGAVGRLAFHGRYWTTLDLPFDGVVFAIERIGGGLFAIFGDPGTPRTLARLRGNRWEPIRHPTVVVPAVPVPREVWIASPRGGLYQAFYFGPPAPRRVVLWWHGGPHEAVSPRLNPYFVRLSQLGFGVLAVNYPGSTGRGRAYEAALDDASLIECLEAVFAYLRENGVGEIVSWSVSAGKRVQSVLLAGAFPVSGIIDQAGVGQADLVDASARRGVPLLVIRGRHDPWTPSARVDHWYDGGHDVTLTRQFLVLFDDVTRFLARVPPVQWAADAAAAKLLIVPEEGDGEEGALTFELAHHLLVECHPGQEVRLARHASDRLGGASPAAGLRAALLAHPAVPVLALRLERGARHRRADRESKRIVLVRRIARVSDDPEELQADGTVVRPRLRELSRTLCPDIEHLTRAAGRTSHMETPEPSRAPGTNAALTRTRDGEQQEP
jgi:hypothetical protein